MRILYILILLLGGVRAYAQNSTPSDHKVGLKTSINFSTLLGDELSRPRPKFGYVAGPYYHYKPTNKWSLYTELLGDFKGSNFSNGDTGYARVALSYITLGMLPTYTLPESNKTVGVGPYVSYLGLASVYVGQQRKPNQSDKLGFANFDLGLAAYYTIKGQAVSFQVGGKIGLLDVNNDVRFESVSPITGTGGLIRNISLDLGMLF